jgi:hypothetical protein
MRVLCSYMSENDGCTSKRVMEGWMLPLVDHANIVRAHDLVSHLLLMHFTTEVSICKVNLWLDGNIKPRSVHPNHLHGPTPEVPQRSPKMKMSSLCRGYGVRHEKGRF